MQRLVVTGFIEGMCVSEGTSETRRETENNDDTKTEIITEYI